MTLLLLLTGFAALVGGGELLVRGASDLAKLLRLSTFVVGLTVVAFGTSSPEMAVSLQGVLRGADSIALGNVVGSNIFNILFILGISSLITPLRVSRQAVRFDVPVMISVSLLVMLFSLDSRISRMEGGVLFVLLLLYLFRLILQDRREAKQTTTTAEMDSRWQNGFLAFVTVLAGLGLLVLGSNWLVKGAIHIAEYWGVSSLVVGLTVVAIGTSLPEVATSVMAGLRGERDIAVGNVIGSNIFNLLGVLGLAALVSPHGIAVENGAESFDVWVMVGVAVVCLPIFFTGGEISRWEGILMLGWYVAYLVFTVLSATGSHLLRTYSAALVGSALPLTLLGLGMSVIVALRRSRRRERETP